MKLYIVGPRDKGEGIYHLLTEKGEPLASHFCSNSFYAFGDLESNRPERKKVYEERFGGYQVLYIGDDGLTEDELLKRNESWFATAQKGEIDAIEKPSVTIEVSL